MAELNEEMVEERRSAFGHVLDEIVSIFNAEKRQNVKDQRKDEKIVKKILYFLWDYLIAGPLYGFFCAVVSIGKASWDAGSSYNSYVKQVIARKEKPLVHYLMYAAYVLWPVALFIIPIGICVITITLLVVVDQVVYPEFPINPKFDQKSNAELSLDRKSALLFEAATHQMNKEMQSLTGWTPNDLSWMPTKWFDNKLNRQIGVRNATRLLTAAMSVKFTNLGHGTKENDDTREGSANLSSPENKWNMGFGDTEVNFIDGLNLLQKYITEANAANGKKMSNINPPDLLDIMNVIIYDVLREPLGRLQEQEKPLTFSELDDEVYYAQGTAIVVRDVLVALRSTFPSIMVKGESENLNMAIEKLSKMADDNPYCVYSIMELGDTRAIFATFYNSAMEQLKVVASSIKV